VQDFRAVCRAGLSADSDAARQLRFVAFDVLELAGEDLRERRWSDRDRVLAEALPNSPLVRRIDTLTATESPHGARLKLGFEGSVLKLRGSRYERAAARGGSSTRRAT
jgi:ATP-dependent DNA ligase